MTERSKWINIESGSILRWIVELERSPQHDVVKRQVFADNEIDAVRFALDDFFKENKTQKVRLKRTYKFIV